MKLSRVILIGAAEASRGPFSQITYDSGDFDLSYAAGLVKLQHVTERPMGKDEPPQRYVDAEILLPLHRVRSMTPAPPEATKAKTKK